MLVEGLALELGDLEFEGGGLTRTIGAGESAGAPRRAWGSKYISDYQSAIRMDNGRAHIPPWTSVTFVS